MTWAGVTRPIDGLEVSTPAIVYGSVVMFVCGGSSTWRSVWTGVWNRVRNWRRRAGRHFANAPRPKARKPPPPPWPRPLPCPNPPAPVGPAGAVFPPDDPWSFAMHFWIASCSAAVGGVIRRWMLNVCPPAFRVATIFGTVPSWCSAISTRPSLTAATPPSLAICFAWAAGNVSWVPGRKKSWTKCWPGLPSFERSVITELFAARRSRESPPPPEPPPNGPPPKPLLFVCAARVTVRSVPMPESGSSAFFCALSSPCEIAEIATTSATPRPEAEHRQDRARTAAEELVTHVVEEEHRAGRRPATSKNGVRLG